jgi:hypothetical protein
LTIHLRLFDRNMRAFDHHDGEPLVGEREELGRIGQEQHVGEIAEQHPLAIDQPWRQEARAGKARAHRGVGNRAPQLPIPLLVRPSVEATAAQRLLDQRGEAQWLRRAANR